MKLITKKRIKVAFICILPSVMLGIGLGIGIVSYKLNTNLFSRNGTELTNIIINKYLWDCMDEHEYSIFKNEKIKNDSELFFINVDSCIQQKTFALSKKMFLASIAYNSFSCTIRNDYQYEESDCDSTVKEKMKVMNEFFDEHKP